MNHILELKNITKDYGNTRALDNINLSLEEGKIYGLVGENGAGKSTLAKIISGGVRSDKGELIFKGKQFSYITPSKARELEISIVHQEGDLSPNLNVVDNIFLGNEIKGSIGMLEKEEMIKKAKEILSRFKININLETPVNSLSPTYQQIISICKALSLDSSLLIIDEGGASLDRDELGELFEVLKKLKASGVTIIYISHLLDNVLNLSDEIIILRNGKLIEIVQASESSVSELASYVVGKEVKSEKIEGRDTLKTEKDRIKVESLKCEGFAEEYSFSVKEGEILGFTGPSGCGKTKLLRSIFGLSSLEKGKIYLDGREIYKNSPTNLINKGMAYVPEDRHKEGLAMLRSIEENITLPNLRKWFTFFIDQKKLDEFSTEAAKIASTKMESIHLTPTSLSGGNQQKVAIAKWLTGKYEYFIFNEPYKGIDIGAKQDISNVLQELTQQGSSTIVSSTEFTVLIGLVDRLYIMVNRKIVAELSGKDITNKNIMEYYQSVLT